MYVRTYHEDCLGNKTGKEISKNYWVPNQGPLNVPVRFSSINDLKVFLQNLVIMNLKWSLES